MPQPTSTTVPRRDVDGALILSLRREARLRPEHARSYPGVPPGVWESAAVLADRVMAGGLLLGAAIGWRDRVLHDAHFEFRGGEAGPRARPRREDR